MLKLVGTENDEVVDEKVLVTDEGKLTGFSIFLIALELLVDVCIMCIGYAFVKKIMNKNNMQS